MGRRPATPVQASRRRRGYRDHNAREPLTAAHVPLTRSPHLCCGDPTHIADVRRILLGNSLPSRTCERTPSPDRHPEHGAPHQARGNTSRVVFLGSPRLVIDP
ncbi:hypothetical protein GCM10010271_52320 [Streptomyces kurssanovii]|nr:hypothetical protein GCM10010271_52320 [Streptomyces kurssanovii]